MAKFDQVIQKLRQDYERTIQEGTPDAFLRLQSILEELAFSLREYIQELSQSRMKEIIQHLKNGKALSAEDKDLLKLWIVGDAEAYSRAENDMDNWKEELKRIGREVLRFEGQDIDIRRAFSLSGLLRDGIRTLADVFFYLEQKERISKFVESTKEIDDEERRILIGLLEQKLYTKEF